MPALPPPLQLPVSDSAPRSRTFFGGQNNNNSQPQSHLTSPVPAKTSTIHFSAADPTTNVNYNNKNSNNIYSSSSPTKSAVAAPSSALPPKLPAPVPAVANSSFPATTT